MFLVDTRDLGTFEPEESDYVILAPTGDRFEIESVFWNRRSSYVSLGCRFDQGAVTNAKWKKRVTHRVVLTGSANVEP